jgi:hypothetical protein
LDFLSVQVTNMRTRLDPFMFQVHQFQRRTGREPLRRRTGRFAAAVGRTGATLAVLLAVALAGDRPPGAAAQGPLADSVSMVRLRAPDPGSHRQQAVFSVDPRTDPSGSATEGPSLVPSIGQLLGGVGGGIVGAFIAPAAVLMVYGDELSGGDWEGLLPFMLALATGYCVGSASGVYAVSRVQGRDGSFGAALGGSALALLPAVALTPATAGLSFVLGIPAASAYGLNRSAARRAAPAVPPAPAPGPTPTP